MSIEIHYDEELDTIVCAVVGIVGVQELSDLAPRMLAHPRFRPNMNQLLDLSNGGVDVPSDELPILLQAWLAKGAELGSKGYCLAVAAQRPVDFGQARMYQALSEDLPQSFRVFNGLDRARAWLRQMRSAP